MPNSTADTKLAIARAKTELDLLEQLDLLESEFRLIEIEYRQRRENLAERLSEVRLSDVKILFDAEDGD